MSEKCQISNAYEFCGFCRAYAHWISCACASQFLATMTLPNREVRLGRQKHKDAQCYVRELYFMRATATGEGEERRVDVVVCSEREEAGLAAAAVALWAICLSSAGIVVFFELYALPVAAAAYA